VEPKLQLMQKLKRIHAPHQFDFALHNELGWLHECYAGTGTADFAQTRSSSSGEEIK
jgi:hypothetical protein